MRKQTDEAGPQWHDIDISFIHQDFATVGEQDEPFIDFLYSGEVEANFVMGTSGAPIRIQGSPGTDTYYAIGINSAVTWDGFGMAIFITDLLDIHDELMETARLSFEEITTESQLLAASQFLQDAGFIFREGTRGLDERIIDFFIQPPLAVLRENVAEHEFIKAVQTVKLLTIFNFSAWY